MIEHEQTALNMSTRRYIRTTSLVTMDASISPKAGNMKSKATRLSVLLAALVGLAATVLPVAPAEAQWVFVARKALGRISAHGGSPAEGRSAGLRLRDRAARRARRQGVRDGAGACAQEPRGSRRHAGSRSAPVPDRRGRSHRDLERRAVQRRRLQLLIAGHAASPAEGSTASRVVQAVLRVCKEMGKHCEVGG